MAVLSIAIFGEAIATRLLAGGILIGTGVYLHLSENHEHEHRSMAVWCADNGIPNHIARQSISVADLLHIIAPNKLGSPPVSC